jgi:hypothetical protein
MKFFRDECDGYEWRWSQFMWGVNVIHDGWIGLPGDGNERKTYMVEVGLGFFSFWFHLEEN